MLVTDEQILDLARSTALHKNKTTRRVLIGVAIGDGSTYTVNGVSVTQAEARARCATVVLEREYEAALAAERRAIAAVPETPPRQTPSPAAKAAADRAWAAAAKTNTARAALQAARDAQEAK